jgi:hypothetical protein
MSDLDLEARGRAAESTSPAVQRSVGHASLTSKRYGGLQMKRGGGADDAGAAHEIADRGTAGTGGPLPFADTIQASFGSHDVSDVRAHTDGAAVQASADLGATAFATGEDVAFGGTPDLHTAAHEAAHVVQQRAGVHLKGGVGEVGDPYEVHADAVADKVVAGESAEGLLSQMAGPGGEAGVQSKAVQRIGKPLDQPLDATDPTPAHGETAGKQRRWSPDQYIEMWEEEQGRKMTPEERETIDRGCIGITATNLNGGGNPLDSAEKIFGTFEQAHAAMEEKNNTLNWMARIPWFGERMAGKARYVVFAKMFWSNQDPDEKKRKNPDPKAFLPDPKTGEVDMTGYEYREQPGMVNFDYAFWDEASQSFWHANHMDYGDPADPMIVLQSTKEKFAAGYRDFDRTVYAIALANNYNPGLAAIASGRRGGH